MKPIPPSARPRLGAVALAAALLSLAACAPQPALVEVPGLTGEVLVPQRVEAGAVHVVVFTSHECPIAKAYSPTLRRLAARWSGQPVRLFLAFAGDLDREGVRQHAADYDLPGTIVGDPAHELAAALGATRTPEAVVLAHDGVAYRGRIDDQWKALGSRAPEAARRDLADAVEAALRGERAREPWPAAVGCLLPEPPGRW